MVEANLNREEPFRKLYVYNNMGVLYSSKQGLFAKLNVRFEL